MKGKFDYLSLIRNSGILLLMFITNIILLTSILFFVNISISSFHAIIAFTITVVEFSFIYRKRVNIKQASTSIILVLLLLILAVMVSSKTYDLSWDGNTYHKTAIGSLKNGWNPVYQKVEDFNKEQGNVIDVDKKENNKVWVNHYPKASWIFAANIYSITNNIESAKILNMLMMYVAFTIIFTYLAKRINKILALIVSLLIVVNPLTVPQLFNYYIDGLLGITLFIILYSLIAITDIKINSRENIEEEEERTLLKENFLILANSIIIIINLKFTGLVYAAIFCFLFYCYWLYKSYKEGIFKEKFTKLTIFYVGVVLISVCIAGYSSYVKNIFEKGHPFYPLFGEGKYDIITYNQPKYFKNRNTIQKFAITMFSEGSNIHDSYGDNTDKPKLKIPFTVSKEEIKEYTKPDTRISRIWTVI